VPSQGSDSRGLEAHQGETLELAAADVTALVAYARACLPEEACGLLAGIDGVVARTHLLTNVERSPSTYTIDPREHFEALRQAEREGIELLGCWHSHTHTEAYPSPTDVAQALYPEWVYVVVSLRDPEPAVRGYRIVAGKVCAVTLVIG